MAPRLWGLPFLCTLRNKFSVHQHHHDALTGSKQNPVSRVFENKLFTMRFLDMTLILDKSTFVGSKLYPRDQLETKVDEGRSEPHPFRNRAFSVIAQSI